MAWTESSVNKYLKFQTSAAVASASDAVYSDTFERDPGGDVCWLGMNFSVGSADVVAPLKLQISYDNVNWTTQTTIIADTTPNVTGDKMAFVDLSLVKAPYYRFVWNDGALAAGTSGRFTFIGIFQKHGSPYLA